MTPRWVGPALAVLIASSCGAASSAADSAPTSVAVENVSTESGSTTVSPISSSTVTTKTTTPTNTPTTTPPTSSTTTTTIPDISNDFAAFDRVVTEMVIGAGSRDVSVAVVRNGEVLHTFTAAKGRPGVDPTTPFRLASISKTITTIAALMLVEQGVLSLDTPVVGDVASRSGNSLGDPRMAAITLRQLLSHTSGFDDHLDYFFAPTTDEVTTMMSKALGGELFADPGVAYQYSNINFQLVGMLIEQATGEAYESVVRRLVFDPLGLASFRYATDDANVEGEPWYAVSGGRRYMAMLGPAGAWTASAADIARLIDSLRIDDEGWHPLGATMVDQMFSPQTPSPADPVWDYGLGVRIFASGAVGHTGTIESVHALAITRADGLSFAILVNGSYPKETDDLLGVLYAAELAARAP